MTYTRETLLNERRAFIERKLASLDRKMVGLRLEYLEPQDPIRKVFGSPEFREGREGDGSRKSPLNPLVGTSLGEAIKAAIALANDNPLGPSQWIKFNDQVFYVNADEDLKDVALRVEYVRKTLFPTETEYMEMR